MKHQKDNWEHQDGLETNERNYSVLLAYVFDLRKASGPEHDGRNNGDAGRNYLHTSDGLTDIDSYEEHQVKLRQVLSDEK